MRFLAGFPLLLLVAFLFGSSDAFFLPHLSRRGVKVTYGGSLSAGEGTKRKEGSVSAEGGLQGSVSAEDDKKNDGMWPASANRVISNPSSISFDVSSVDEATGNDNNGLSAKALEIMRREAPLIHDIELKIQNGLETERNMSSVRQLIIRELAKMKQKHGLTVSIQRRQAEERLRELELRLGELQKKNREAEGRYGAFVSGVASGEIRDERQAHSMLDGIKNFCDSIVYFVVNIWTTLYAKCIETAKSVFEGLGNMFHSLLGRRQHHFRGTRV